MRGQFPLLQPFFNKASQDHPLLLTPRPAGSYAMDTVQAILKTPLEEGPSRLLFENKVREYLIFLLVEAAKKDGPQVKLTAREREMLIAAGQRIQQTFNRKLQVGELSRQTGINSTKFKEGFKEVHGNTVKQLSIAARLQEARRLLMKTDLSTKQIKDMVSYAHTTTFIKAFRDYFGYTPNEFRKQCGRL
ncbi:transcriptional regulator, AraC family [Ostertagia ostertagi]